MDAHSKTIPMSFGKSNTPVNHYHTFTLTYCESVDDYPVVETVQVNGWVDLLTDSKQNYQIHTQSTLFTVDRVFDKKENKLKNKNVLVKEVVKTK